MIFKLKYFLFVSVGIIFSCSPLEKVKVSNEFVSMSRKTNSELGKIRTDGAYQQKYGDASKSTDSFYIYNPIFLFDNLTINKSLSFKSPNEFKEWYLKYDDTRDLKYWGVYNIYEDSINAIILTPYVGGVYGKGKLYECHYSGIIKNRESIINWHLVPPYPAIDLQSGENKYLIDEEKKPINLYFKQVSTKGIINYDKNFNNK